jgi:pyruvate/2-oxoglutarate dehydrogenase complex dihydrolipoamide dehydrogenase (E3) component
MVRRKRDMFSNPLSPDSHANRSNLESLRPARWKNPRPAQTYDLVVLGAGPAGLTTAYEAAKLGAKVALVERKLLGGNCLNTGCIPSKTLIRTSRLYAEMRSAENYGVQVPGSILVDFSAAMDRVRRVRARIGRESAAVSLRSQGVDVFFGQAKFEGPDCVIMEGIKLRFQKALIATGTRPTIPPIPGLTAAGFLTHENVFHLTERPNRLLFIGGGPIGCELSQVFCRLGSRVAIVRRTNRRRREFRRDLIYVRERAGLELSGCRCRRR